MLTTTEMTNQIRRKLFTLAFCTIIYTLNVLAAPVNQMISNYLTVDDGLTSNKVYDMLQDDDGYIWLGTAYGLCRYDGYRFTNYYFLGSGDFTQQANLGNLFADKENNLLWVRTAVYTYACYDLAHKQFINFAGDHDIHKSYRRCMFAKSGFWMYDDTQIRQVMYDKGNFECHDYQQDDGTFPKEKIIRLVEDNAGNIWVITEKSVFTIGKDHKLAKQIQGIPISRGCAWGDKVYLLTKDNRVLVYGTDKKRKSILTIPENLTKVGSQNGNFVWQDKWVIFTEDKTLVMNFSTQEFSTPSDCQIGYNAILLDEFDGNYCVSGGGTLFIFPSKGNVKRLDLMNNLNITTGRNRKFSTTQGPDGKFYIASYGNGLFVYDPVTETLEHHLQSDPRPLIASDYLLDIMFDSSGLLWVSQEDAGVACIHITEKIEDSYLRPAPQNPTNGANHIYMLYRKKNGEVMVSTRDNNLYSLNPENCEFKHETVFKSSPFTYIIDQDGHTWVGTRNNGLYIDGQQYSRLDTLHYFPAVAVYDVAVDKKRRIWIATWEQGLLLTQYPARGDLQLTQFLNSDMNENRINDIDIDQKGRMWIATYNGLYSVDTNKEHITKEDFLCYNIQNKMLPINEIHCMMVASDGTLWIGGMGTGALHLNVENVKKPVVETIGTKQGLPNYNIYSFAEDQDGNIWIATEGKLARLSKESGAIDSYQLGDDIQSSLYSHNCAVRLDNGKLLFGTANGIVVVNPKAVGDKKSIVHSVATTCLAVNGTIISQGEEWSKLFDGSQLQLSHNQNTLKFYFSNFAYDNIQSSMYQFYLEGFEKDWNEPTIESSVEYGNLPPGRYTFHLRSVNGNQTDSQETTLDIRICQPWWNTWWAWMLYLVLAAAIAYYVYKNWHERFNLHQQMKLEKQLTKFRIDFFTHVAHEFRTPLSIITGAASKMSESNPQSVTKKAVQTVKRGSRRLSQLVNQLLEFQKVNTESLRLRVEESDIVGFIRDIFQDFWNMAQQREQNITFTPFTKQYMVAFDKHIVDTVVYNLLSNAIKYTPEKGTITMKLTKEGEQLLLTVEDNGPGISEERQQKLFHPFMEGEVSPGGIGIGLYTSYKMAEKHHGSLKYQQLNSGSQFTFTLPADSSPYTSDDFKTVEAIDQSAKKERSDDPMIRELMPVAMNNHTVVVIEDDPDMLDMILSELSVYFKTEGFTEGQKGYDGVVKVKPSLVLCDVTLGDTTGFEIVRQIKNNEQTAHIPVIMLTGHGGEDYIIRGYKAGADDYMVKPCNFHVLVARMAQLIKWGEQSKANAELVKGDENKSSAKDDKTGGSAILTSRSDKLFLEKMQSLMEQHIDDPDFTMDQLAQLMNMGRTKFYGKAKELTGMSPNKYLLAERMKLAGKLLYEGNLTVSEVCYRVGIQDLSYFNKCFKAAYGVTPSKYGK